MHIPVDKLLDLSGKKSIVTGGATGIGLGIVKRLAQAGSEVLILDVNIEAMDKAIGEFKDKGLTVDAREMNVGREKEVQSVFGKIEAGGGVDILVNNAGIFPSTPALSLSAEEWDRVIDTNLKGTFLCAQAAGRIMKNKGGGVIINIASIDAFHPSMVGFAHYDASKGGAVSLTKNLALELGPYKIRVVCIAPGGIWTEGTRASALKLCGGAIGQDFFDAFTAKVPLGRMGDADDIATVVLFAASPAADYMTGNVIIVDGGVLLS